MRSKEAEERKRIRQKERYNLLKSKGICVMCAREDACSGHILCPECWEKKDNAIKPLTAEERATKYANNRELYKTRKDNRLCVRCAKALTETEGVRCGECARNHNRQTKQAYRKSLLDYDQCRAKDICVACRKMPALENRTICSKCYTRMLNHMITVVQPKQPRRRVSCQG